jgi:hypothetical protein
MEKNKISKTNNTKMKQELLLHVCNGLYLECLLYASVSELFMV